MFNKPLGTGVVCTALKRGDGAEEDVAATVASMLTLNRETCEEMSEATCGCTDVSGSA